MSIRTYLILAFTLLSLLLTLGMWLMGERAMHEMTQDHLKTTEKVGAEISGANYRLSEKILSRYGEKLVETKAEDVARELSHLLQGQDLSSYDRLRRDDELRRIATQETFTLEGQVAGYMALLDCQGAAVLHPTPGVEGENFSRWKDQYPEMWGYVSKSCNQPKVKGYYTFFDDQGKKRDKYMVLVQVPQTPFIVAATVNIDEFFLPAHRDIKRSLDETMEAAKASIASSSESLAWRAEINALITGVAFAFLGSLFGLSFAAMISRPLLRLQQGVREVGEGNLTVAVPAKGAREIINLARAFNDLGRQLTEYIEKRDFIRDTFGRYVTQEVVKKLLEDKGALELGGETREVSIIMSDLRGFTAITADMHPEDVVTFLNRYLGKMIEILTDNQAVIDEILGDGILAFFGAPTTMEDHPARTVACALQMQAAMDEINALNEADNLPHLEMGIAVNTGEVVVGNIGSERRTKYSVVGAHVNFTSRIEAFAVGGQVLISTGTYERIRNLIEVREVVETQMKGVTGTITLYDVGAIGAPYNISLTTKTHVLTPLPRPLEVRLDLVNNKLVTGTIDGAQITELCESAALVALRGELQQWQDVRLQLLDEDRAGTTGKIYGKVTEVKPGADDRLEVYIRFTSVSPETYQVIRQAVGV